VIILSLLKLAAGALWTESGIKVSVDGNKKKKEKSEAFELYFSKNLE